MKQRYFFVAYLIVLALVSRPVNAQIRGRAFQDANANGRFDSPSEPGIVRVRVRVYNRLGQLLATTTTDTAGEYSLPRLPAQPLRVQFDELPPGFYPTPGQFLTRFNNAVRADHDLGLYQPSTYVGDNPRLAISIQPLGNHKDGRMDSLDIGTIRFLQSNQDGRTTKLKVNPAMTGSIWGLAHDRNHNRLFSAALAKRHSGFGALGSGGIYQTDLATGETQPFVSLDALGAPTGPPSLTRDLTATYEGRMNDSLLFAWVGKMGLGGIDLSENGRIVYTVNLYDGKLYALQLPTTGQPPIVADLTSYSLPKTNCKGGTFRLFAVKVHQGKVYVGGVCDAQRSGKAADLQGYVYAFDPLTKRMTEVLTIPLNYNRGPIEYDVGNWFAWTDDPRQVMLTEPAWWAIHPQPILSDLEFDTDGSLLIGLMDRLGHQMATGKGSADGRWQQTISMAAGDVLRASPRRKSFQLEGNAQVGERQSAGENNAQGPKGGEFYYDDTFVLNDTRYHQENGMGGLALLPGSGQVLVSSREPVAEYNSAGISIYDNLTGKKVSGLVAYHHNPSVDYVGRKTNHVGDIEIIGSLPPTLVGHRIWQDCDEDGIQDADETGLAGVIVELWHQATKLAATRTDSLGLYSFDSRALPDGLKPGKEYELRVPFQQHRYGQLQLVPTHNGLNELINNDAIAEAQYARIKLNVTAPGENQLSLDFGFRCVEKPQSIAKLQCSGTDWTNAKISLVLDHYSVNERYDLTFTPTYSGLADYSTGGKIPAQGQLLTQPLAALMESELTVRVFNAKGCYQDVFVNITQSAECVRLLTNSVEEGSADFWVSPNPTHDRVSIHYRGKTTDPVTLKLFSANSRLLNQEILSSASDGAYQYTLDLTRHNPGIYIISILQGDKIISRKIIRH